MLAKASSILLLYWRIVDPLTAAHALRPAAQRLSVNRPATALTEPDLATEGCRQVAAKVN
jgi:hypothetical protein